jgi:hypothetical protein
VSFVAPPGLEPGRTFVPGILKRTSGGAEDASVAISPGKEHEEAHEAHGGPGWPIQVGKGDPVEQALADSITKAVAAGRFDMLPDLVAELAARRKARAGVVSLDAERTRRGKA